MKISLLLPNQKARRKYVWTIGELAVKRIATDVLLFFNIAFLANKKFFVKTFFTDMARRFMSITDDDVEIFIEGEENENTKKKRSKMSRLSSHSLQAKSKQTSQLK